VIAAHKKPHRKIFDSFIVTVLTTKKKRTLCSFTNNSKGATIWQSQVHEKFPVLALQRRLRRYLRVKVQAKQRKA
jgi:hypothetical protein